jgi:hypothetical protein
LRWLLIAVLLAEFHPPSDIRQAPVREGDERRIATASLLWLFWWVLTLIRACITIRPEASREHTQIPF